MPEVTDGQKLPSLVYLNPLERNFMQHIPGAAEL